MSQNKHTHGKTSDMYVDSGVRGAKTAAAAKANQTICDGVSMAAIKAKVPVEIVQAEWFQNLVKGIAPGLIHYGATNYPQLVPSAIGSHRVVMGASLATEAFARDVIEPLFAALTPMLSKLADLAPADEDESDTLLTVVNVEHNIADKVSNG